MSAPDTFLSVTRDEPCVICGKGDWCRRSPTGGHECHRIDEPAVSSYERVANTGSGYTVYRRADDRDTLGPPAAGRLKFGKRPDVHADLAAEDRKFRAAISSDRKVSIARQLGVNVASLESIGIGIADAEDLKRLRASGNGWREDFPQVVSSFPEGDATGAIIGICFRADDGRKGSPSGKVGAKRGLIIPATLPNRPGDVLLVEGHSDVAACETLCLASVGRPSNIGGGKLVAQLLARRDVLVIGENDRNPAGGWPGRDGARRLAEYLATRWKEPVRWSLPPEGFKDIRGYLNHLIANGLDVNDQAACHQAGQELLHRLIATAEVEQPAATAAPAGQADDNGAREELLRLCVRAGDHFFHDNEQRAYVVVREGVIAQTLSIRSREYALLLGRRYYQATRSGLPTTAKSEAISTLEGMALFDGSEERVFVRVGEYEDKIVVDLCDDQWRVVVIDETGWQVLNESPIRFRRARGMLALPEPMSGGSIDKLRPYFNVRSHEDFILVCAFLIGCFNPKGPYIILLVNGEPGAAKSTLCRLLRAMIDPNKAPLRCEPKDNRDLAIAANNAWLVGLDNMSQISERVSNALCRLATGGGFATRELYTDSDEAIFDAKRPVVINGIGHIADRSDLLDRAVRVTLPTIPEDQRRIERIIWTEYEDQRSTILGAILDAVSTALRNKDSVQFARLPRMADWAAWIVAAEPACPWPRGAFLAALDSQRKETDEFVIEASPLANAVMNCVEHHGDLEGTATELLERLSAAQVEKTLKHRDWPKGAPHFGTKLREVAPNLRRLGIEVKFGRGGDRRTIRICRASKPPESLSSLSLPSPSSPDHGPGGCKGVSAGPMSDSDSPFCDSDLAADDSEAPVLDPDEPPCGAQNRGCDSDDSDDSEFP